MSNKNNTSKIENILEHVVEKITGFVVKNGVIILASLVLIGGIVIGISVYHSSIKKADEKLLVELESIVSSYGRIYYDNANATDITGFTVQAADKLKEIVRKAKTKNLKLRASFTLAGIYFDIENYTEAIKYYKDVANNRGFYLSDIAMFNMATSYVELKQYDDATKTFENLIKMYPKSYITPQANVSLSDVYVAKNERAKAVSILKNWLTQNKDNKEDPYVDIITEAIALVESNVY